MSTLRRSIIHAALEAGHSDVAERLMAGPLRWTTMVHYANFYGV